MKLSTKDVSGASGGNSMGTQIAEGVYVQKTKIKRVLNISGKDIAYFAEPESFDLGITVELNEPDVSFVPSIDIFGNFKREAGQIVGWGSAFKVGRFFRDLGIVADLTDDNKIPAEWLGQCVGRPVMKLIYSAGPKKDNPSKAKWVTWDLLIECGERSDEEAVAVMQEQWEYQRSQGYPKNYDTSALTKESSNNSDIPVEKAQRTFDPVAASQGSAPAKPSQPIPDPVDDDDDIPF